MGCGGSRGMAPGDLPDRHSAGVRVGSVRKKNVPALDIGKNKNSNDRKAVREHSFVTLNTVRDPDELAFEGAANITMATSLKRLLGDGRANVTLTADRTLPYMSLTKHDENSKSETTEIACKYVTLFHVACAFNNHKPTKHPERGITPLMVAAACGATKCARALLAAGASPDVRECALGTEGAKISGRTALHVALEAGHSSMIKELLQAKADVELLLMVSGETVNPAEKYLATKRRPRSKGEPALKAESVTEILERSLRDTSSPKRRKELEGGPAEGDSVGEKRDGATDGGYVGIDDLQEELQGENVAHSEAAGSEGVVKYVDFDQLVEAMESEVVGSEGSDGLAPGAEVSNNPPKTSAEDGGYIELETSNNPPKTPADDGGYVELDGLAESGEFDGPEPAKVDSSYFGKEELSVKPE